MTEPTEIVGPGLHLKEQKGKTKATKGGKDTEEGGLVAFICANAV